MKKLILFFAILNIGVASYGQVTPTCGTDVIMNSILANDSFAKKRIEMMNLEFKQLNSARTVTATLPTITIPVVFYVVYDPAVPATNVSDNQVQSQLTALNTGFSAYDIKFCLATRAGSSTTTIPGTGTQTTNGILHINNAALSSNNYNTNLNQLVSLADPSVSNDRYLKIWVVKDISGINAGTLAYASFPNMSSTFDGVVIKYNVFGDATNPLCNCTLLPTYHLGKVLIHEIGHYLGLYHTFQGGCTGMDINSCDLNGDFVCDTPPVNSANFSCLTGMDSCIETPNLPDDIHNYMDYGDNNCMTSFTNGQKTRMFNTLNNYRDTLFSADNLVFSGTCGYTNIVSAAFSANTYSPCAGNPVNFTPAGGTVTYLWDFGDGTTSTSATPSHTYNAINSPYTVTLTTTNSAGTTSAVSTAKIFVTNCVPINNTESNWYVSRSHMLKFNTGVPVFDTLFPVMTGFYTNDTVESQSDNSGNLLFYNNSNNVWNNQNNLINNNQLMLPNQVHYIPNNSIIVPKPPSTGNLINEYYIFTNKYHPNHYTTDEGLRYSIVNINGANATIGVYKAPITIPQSYGFDTNSADGCINGGFYGVTAVKKCYGNDYWLLAQLKKGTSQYIVTFSLSSSGISYSSEIQLPTNSYLLSWYIEASPNGNKVFCYSLHDIDLSTIYDFNKSNGVLSDAKQISQVLPGQGFAGASFSPDSKLLYLTDYFGKALYQYNVNSVNINQSRKKIGNFSSKPFCIQQGPDNKLYVTMEGKNELAVIHNPNNLITTTDINACNFSMHGPNRGSNIGWGLPNMIDAKDATAYFPANNSNVICSYITGCNTYKFFPNICGTAFNWTFTNSTTGTSATSTATDPVYNFTTNGNYTITLRDATNTTVLGTTTLTITGLPTPVINGSSYACTAITNGNITNNSVVLQTGDTVQWSVSSGGTISGASNQSNVTIAWTTLPGTINVSITNSAGCVSTGTKTITVGSTTIPTFTQIAPICSGTLFVLPTTSNNGVLGIWTPAISNTVTRTYTFTPTTGQCITSTTTMTIVVKPLTDPSCNTCPSNLTLITEPNTTFTYKSSNWIMANSNYSIASGKDITMKAQNYISLMPNTHIVAGANYLGKIEVCVAGAAKMVSREVETVSSSEISIYPNPTNDFVTIETDSLEIGNIMIVSFDGKMVYNQVATGNTANIDLSNYASGIYLLTVETKNGEIVTKKLIKK